MDVLTRYYKESLLDNLCQEYKGLWQSAHDDKEKLMKLCLRQQAIPHVATYAYQRKGITKKMALEDFGAYINGYTIHDADDVKGYTYGLYVDYDYDNDLIIDKDVVHIMWTVGASVVVPITKCPIIYISNHSNVHVVCEGYNHVKIYLFDQSKVTLEDVDQESQVTIYRYSDKAKVEQGKFCLSYKIKTFDKELKL